MYNIIIEKPSENDAETINDLIIGVFMQCVAPDYSQEGVNFFLNVCKPEEIKMKLNEGNFIIVAKYQKKIVGVIWMRDINHISRFFVTTTCQGKGIGRKLFNHMLSELKSNYPDVKEVTVYSSPVAVKAYQKLGFEKTNTEQIGNGMRYTPMSYNIF